MKINYLIPLILSFNLSVGQSLSRQTISTASGGNSQNGVAVRQTVGQPYQTNTSKSGEVSLRPGFQQPVFYTELISSTMNVRIIPNPALYSFSIESSDSLYKATLSVYDEIGRLIYSENFDHFIKTEIHCANWANGVYLITVTDNKKNLITSRLIKHN